MSDLKERQEDELQVLQAVFMSDYEDLRTKDAWKVIKQGTHGMNGEKEKEQRQILANGCLGNSAVFARPMKNSVTY